MGFVKFTEVGKNFTPKVSINPRGMMSFNQGAKRKFAMDQFTHAVLYFDAADRTIGFEMTNNDETEGAHKLRIKESGVEVNARGFLTFFELEPQTTQTFGLAPGPDATFLIIDLAQGQQGSRADDGNSDDTDVDMPEVDEDGDLDADLVAAMDDGDDLAGDSHDSDDDDDVVVTPITVQSNAGPNLPKNIPVVELRARNTRADVIEDKPKIVVNGVAGGAVNGHAAHKTNPAPRRSVKSFLGELLSD